MSLLDTLRQAGALQADMNRLGAGKPSRLAELERECELRRQEHIAACKRVDERDAEIARLKRRVAALRRALRFVQHANTWANADAAAKLALAADTKRARKASR